jgi:hypothetical protein
VPRAAVARRGGVNLDALDLDALMPKSIDGDLEGLQAWA